MGRTHFRELSHLDNSLLEVILVRRHLHAAQLQIADIRFGVSGQRRRRRRPLLGRAVQIQESGGDSYDVENRIISQYLDRNVPTWAYDPSGKRVAQYNNAGTGSY